MLAFKTLSLMYLRYFSIILIALVGFMVGFDLMDGNTKLPASANLVLIYVMYKTFFAVDMMLPVTLVFAMIASMVDLVRSNALTAYYAMGYSKARVMAPFITASSILVVIHIALHMTNFARAEEFADNLSETSQLVKPTSNLFFTHEGNYVYFGNLYPLARKAEDIRIFGFEGNRLKEVIAADEAVYDKEHWNIKNASIVRPPEDLTNVSSGIVTEEQETVRALQDFKPKILDQVYEGKDSFTIGDGLDALQILQNQNVDVAKITSVLYRTFFSPWFAVMLMVIIFTFTPVSARFANLPLFSFTAILGTLLVWGLFFILGELSNTKTLAPEAGIFGPLTVLFGVMIWRLGNPLRRVRVKSRKI